MNSELVMYQINENTLIKLKHPLGRLLVGPTKKTMSKLKEVIKNDPPRKIFAIGDIVSSNIIKNKIKVDCVIIDFKTKREPAECVPLNNFEIICVKNPASVITSEAYETIKKVVKKSTPTAIVVDGEEDLLALPIIQFAPINSLVVYGQPYAGIVIVKIVNRIKLEIKHLLEKMIFH